MKIGILISFICNFGEKGFYNSQEIGLAKALAKTFEKVTIIKLLSSDKQGYCETLGKDNNIEIKAIPCKSYGINGIVDTKMLDTSLDALIYFSDTQFALPKVYKWTKKHNIKFLPYIGVTESHSTSRLKRLVVNFLFNRNIKVYKKCRCFAKTPHVKTALHSLGVKQVEVAPVGLDLELLKTDYAGSDVIALKKKYGYNAEDKILLFIGRFIQEKEPLRMLDIYKKAAEKDKSCKLLMVGTGELELAVREAVNNLAVCDKVQIIDKIPNSDIWELYRIAHAFVNLNQQEIFGMAILEAMYYGCKVVACKAPGPDYIINNGEDGCIATTDDEITDAIANKQIDAEKSHQRIVQAFTWANTAKLFCKGINNS